METRVKKYASHTPPAAGQSMAMELAPARISVLVDRFLCWPLPQSVCSDPCVLIRGYPNRIGTNLLTDPEARQMIEYLFQKPTPEEGK